MSETTADTIAAIEAAVLHAVDAIIHPAAAHAEAAPSEPVKTVDVVAAEPVIESTEIKLGPTNVGE